MELQTIAEAQSTQVPVAVGIMGVLSKVAVGDLAGTQYWVKRLPTAAGNIFRSADRFTSSGSTDATNGGYWGLTSASTVAAWASGAAPYPTGLIVAAPATGVAATDTANLQAAINAAINNVSKSVSGPPGQSALMIPGGNYQLTGPLALTDVCGLRMFGSGRFSTTISNLNGTGVIISNGLQYSSIESMTLNGLGIGDSAPVLDIDWDNTGLSSQSNTFKDLYIQNTSCGVRLGNSGFQVSENIFIDCGFTLCGNGILTQNYNVLDNVVIGGNFLLCGIGINMFHGAVETILGVGFEQSSVQDIFASSTASAWDTYHIAGCRTESLNFLSILRGSANVTSCTQTPSASVGVFAEGTGYGTIKLDSCICYGVIQGSGANGLCNFTVENCQFSTPAATAFGNPGIAATVRNTYVNGLLDTNPAATFIPDGYYSAGQSYTQVQQTVTSSITLGAPGTYGVTATGVTLVLPAGVPQIPGRPRWVIKNLTGSTTPNITVTAAGSPGTIDTLSSYVMNGPNARESISLNPYYSPNAWLIE